jgi:hypothetical protein
MQATPFFSFCSGFRMTSYGTDSLQYRFPYILTFMKGWLPKKNESKEPPGDR